MKGKIRLTLLFVIAFCCSNAQVKKANYKESLNVDSDKLHLAGGPYTPPFFDNFDSINNGWSTSLLNGSVWQIGSPTYPSLGPPYSGAFCWDITLNGYFSANSTTFLISPVFNLLAAVHPRISFYQKYDTQFQFDGSSMEYYGSPDFVWTKLGSINDSNSVNWYNTSIPSGDAWSGNSQTWIRSQYRLDQFTGNTFFRLRYVFKSDNIYNYGGNAIDDFRIEETPVYDLELWDIHQNEIAAGGNSSQVYFTIYNNGYTEVPDCKVLFSVNGITVDSLDIVDTIPENGFYTDSVTLDFPPGKYSVCATVTYPADTIHPNDSKCTEGYRIFTVPIPYSNNFESDTLQWLPVTTNRKNAWQEGTPQYGVTTGAHSGIKCWDTNLSTKFQHGIKATLTSPYFTVPASSMIRMNFYTNYLVDFYHAGYNVEWQQDTGSWTALGAINDPYAENWYDATTANFAAGGFTGNSGMWKHPEYKYLYVPSDSVRFRFVFNSDNIATGDGVSIDDFVIEEVPPVDLSLDLIPFAGEIGLTGNARAVVANFGYQPLTNFSINCLLNGISTGNYIYNDTLFPGVRDTVYLSSFTIPAGSFSLCASATVVNDTDTANNSSCTTGEGVTLESVPYFNDFNSGPVWKTETTGDSYTLWELGTPSYGSTSSAYSGVKCWDINLDEPYYEFANTTLYSPYFNITTQDDTLSFWANYYIDQPDKINVQYDIDFSGNWQLLDTLSGQSNIWKEFSYAIKPLLSTGVIQFRFNFISDQSISGDGISIDDFRIHSRLNKDIHVASLLEPDSASIAYSTRDIRVRIKNEGLLPANAFNVHCNYNGVILNAVNIAAGLQPYDSIDINLGPVQIQHGEHQIVIYTDMPNEEDRNNDTLTSMVTGVISYWVPYSNAFESPNDWIVKTLGNSLTNWESGLPAFGMTSSVHSGQYCWDVNLSTPYGGFAYTSLYSPVFNFTYLSASIIDFWMNYNMEFGSDGCNMQYSTDLKNWTTLGTVNDILGVNWYNLQNLTVLDGDGWSGFSNGWQHAHYNASAFDGMNQVQFRFLFRSDALLSADGISLDDFAISGITTVEDIKQNDELYIYPVPVLDVIHIKATKQIFSVQIIDATGRVLIDKQCNSIHAEVSTISLRPGVYFVKVESETSKTIRKIIKSE